MTPVLVTPPTRRDAPDTVLALIKVLAAESTTSTGRPTPRSATGCSSTRCYAVAGNALALRVGLKRRAREWPSGRTATSASSCRCRSCEGPCWKWVAGCAMSELLEEPEDVFHLRLEEARGDQRSDDARERREAALGRAHPIERRREELAGVRLIDPSAVFPQRAAGDALITGTPASSGSATGPVRLIHGPGEFGRLAAAAMYWSARTRIRPGPPCSSARPPWSPTPEGQARMPLSSPGSTASRRSWARAPAP